MTLKSYEKVIDARTSATKVKRTNMAAKRLSFFGEKKPNTADGTLTESRPTVCIDQNVSDNDESEKAGCAAVLCEEELPYVKTASSPARTPRRASRDGTDNSGRSTTAQRVLRDDTDELQISTSGRRHRRDVTSTTPKRTSVNACECVQRVCNKEQYKHACNKCDKKTDTDYAPVSRHVVTSGRRHRHSPVSSSSDSDSKHPRLSSNRRQSRRRRRSGSSRPGSSDRRRRQAAHRSATSSGSRSGSRSYIRCDKFDGKTGVDTYLAKFEACAEYNNWTAKDKAAHLKSALT